ncbi:MAG: sugar phosphate isomerase/epimerase, partial [Phycisphaerales bacterium]|nr:sugar phosphate isomerase/epimerase [Phycisphaerales bacterium]
RCGLPLMGVRCRTCDWPLPTNVAVVRTEVALESLERQIDSLRQAAALSAAHISTEPGGPLYGAPRRPAEIVFLDGVQRVARIAEEVGVSLLIEPEPELLIETAAEFAEFMQHVESPAVGLNFDVGHQYCVGEDPADSFERLYRWVRHVHLEDIAATRKHHHLIPGDGAIDIAAFLRRARQLGYEGWITIELYPFVDDPIGAARRAFDFVQPLMDAK